jgi:thymidylate synthase (FAD)
MPEKELKVHLIQATPNAERVLAFAKNTRLLGSKEDYNNIFNRQKDQVKKDVEYSMSTIRGPLEFIHYIFLIQNASRAMTHQLVRHRVMSFAQQSLRISSSYDYYIPPGIEIDEIARDNYQRSMNDSHDMYKFLTTVAGIDMQDARGVLPINTTSAILMKANLRAMLELFEVRLCLRVQGEFQGAAHQMANIIKDIHPFTADYIGPNCIVHGHCLFPRFESCPVSKAVPELRGLPEDRLEIAHKVWTKNAGKGIQPK